MSGGAGADDFFWDGTFELTADLARTDHILDVNIAEGDEILIRFAATLGGGRPGGGLASDTRPVRRLRLGHLRRRREIPLRHQIGTLWHDSDGACGAGAALALAVLENGTVDAAHIRFG